MASSAAANEMEDAAQKLAISTSVPVAVAEEAILEADYDFNEAQKRILLQKQQNQSNSGSSRSFEAEETITVAAEQEQSDATGAELYAAAEEMNLSIEKLAHATSVPVSFAETAVQQTDYDMNEAKEWILANRHILLTSAAPEQQSPVPLSRARQINPSNQSNDADPSPNQQNVDLEDNINTGTILSPIAVTHRIVNHSHLDVSQTNSTQLPMAVDAQIVQNNDDVQEQIKELRVEARRKGCYLATFLIVIVIAASVAGVLLANNNRGNPNENSVGGGESIIASDDFGETGNNGAESSAGGTHTTAEKPSPSILSTWDEVTSRGRLRCAMYVSYFGFSSVNYAGEASGFTFEICRAIAAVVLGDPNLVEPVVVTGATRFLMLQNRTADVMTMATHSMGRDVLEQRSLSGFTMSVPYYYNGLVFAGDPNYVDCADNLDFFSAGCRDVTICVREGTTYVDRLQTIFPGPIKVYTQSHYQSFQALQRGDCNVVADASVAVPKPFARSNGYSGPYGIGKNLFSKEVDTLVTRDDDPSWSNLINLIVNALYTAEAHDITKATASTTELFNSDAFEPGRFGSVLVDIIETIGNMEELYARTLHSVLARSGMNTLNSDGSTGLIYSNPFGELETVGEPTKGGLLETIIDRGFIRCGVTQKVGFAELDTDTNSWSGFDVEYCRALAAAIYPTSSDSAVNDQVEFVEIAKDSQRFPVLASGYIDVLAGERVTLLNNWEEPTTGEAYTYSRPYFYDNNNNSSDAFALATRQDDNQWSDFVFWVVMGTFYAEENGIDSKTAYAKMPLVSLFGERLKQMFLSCIYEVGNYGDMYNRTIGQVVPRSGRNQLNQDRNPQQFAVPFV